MLPQLSFSKCILSHYSSFVYTKQIGAQISNWIFVHHTYVHKRHHNQRLLLMHLNFPIRDMDESTVEHGSPLILRMVEWATRDWHLHVHLWNQRRDWEECNSHWWKQLSVNSRVTLPPGLRQEPNTRWLLNLNAVDDYPWRLWSQRPGAVVVIII